MFLRKEVIHMEKTRRFNRLITILLAIIMVVCLLPTLALAAEDISSHWAIADINYLKDKAIIAGDPNGDIRPDSQITRAEFVKVINRAFEYTDKAATNFPDVDSGAWFAEEFLIAKQAGYIQGDDNGNAAPDRAITRGEVAVILVRILNLPLEGSSAGFTDDADTPQWAAPSVAALKKAGFISGYPDGSFRAEANLTRAEGFKIIASILREQEIGTPVLAAYTIKVPGSADYNVNYVLVTLEGAADLTFTWKGASISATKVTTDGKLLKVAVPAGDATGILTVKYNDKELASKEITFAQGKAAPNVIYGTVPMLFSEFFHDVTADDISAYETTTFSADGVVETPELFITGGTRTGGNGTDTYAVADKKPKVDAISSATYGDSVHYVPNGNQILTSTGTADRLQKPPATDPTEILGISKVEVAIDFDLFANAKLLNLSSKSTAQSQNVLAKLGSDFELVSIKVGSAYVDSAGAPKATAGIYAQKEMLVDGNWGSRATTPVDASVVKDLPGEGIFTGEVTYGGNWGDYMIDCSFVDEGGDANTVLGPDYSGAGYFDNFAEYMYAGYIEDEDGNIEPLVFLQNLFTHRMHVDFDVALSPSRFARLNNLTLPGEYKVTVLVWGFEDVTFTFEIENELINLAAAISPASAEVTGTGDIEFIISDIENVDNYIAKAELNKGSNPAGVKGTDYTLTKSGDDVKLTIKSSYISAGNYWGSYILSFEDSGKISKNISLTLVNGVVPELRIGDSKDTPTEAGTEADPIEVTKADGKIFFSDSDFASAITIGARGGSTFRKDGETAAVALANNTTFKNDGANSYIDLSNEAFVAGETYEIVMRASGFNVQTYFITITA